MSSFRLDVELFNGVAVALISLFADAKGPAGKDRELSLSPLRSHQERTREGRDGHS